MKTIQKKEFERVEKLLVKVDGVLITEQTLAQIKYLQDVLKNCSQEQIKLDELQLQK